MDVDESPPPYTEIEVENVPPPPYTEDTHVIHHFRLLKTKISIGLCVCFGCISIIFVVVTTSICLNKA